MRLNELHTIEESQQLELKESFSKETVETVAAFSNAQGGVIVVGVAQNGHVIGINVTEETLKDWVNTIEQATQPQIFPEISLQQINEKPVVVIKVQEYPVKPVACKGKYLKRVGASNHQLTVPEIVEMQLYSINSSFDSFTVNQPVSELDLNLVKKFFTQLEKTGRINVSDDSLVNLKKTGLLRDGQLTWAALLLFGEHQTGIRIGRFKTPDVIIDDILIKSPLTLAVDEAMTFIKKSISLSYEFTGELRRKEVWQFPLPVIRELLMNAIVHKDYRNPTDTMIKIFDDRIVFTNPGSLMGGLKPEDLLKGDYVAVHRNKLLAEAFYLRGDIEKFGTGYYRIQTELKNYPGIQFAFETLDGFMRCTLAIDAQDTPQDTPQDKYDEMTLINNLVLKLNGEMKRQEIQLILKLQDQFHFRDAYLRPAIEAGLIEMTIPDKPNSKHQKYRLTEKGKQMKKRINNE
jgi:ATP-dependent DNA helicase RecG